MEPYDLIRFIHIAAAVALLAGSVVGSPAVRAAVRRARTTQEMRAHVAIGRPLLILEPASAVVVLVSGVYLTNVGNFWGLGWVQVAVAFWVVNSVVAVALVKPVMSRLAGRVSVDGPVGQELDALRCSPRWSIGGDVVAADDAALLFLMTMQPDLVGSLLAVAATNLGLAAVRVVGYGFRRVSAAADVSVSR